MSSPSDSVKLVVQTGPGVGQVFEVGTYPQTIGRGAGVDIHLSEQTLSRHHARIQAAEQGCVVEDLGSTNGTFVNGQRLTAPTVCRNGDTLQVGEVVTLTIQIPHSNLDDMATVAEFDAPGFEPTIAPGAMGPSYGASPPPQSSSNRTAWLVVGVVVTLVLLIVGVGLALLYFTNTFQPASPTVDPAALLASVTPAAPATDTPPPAETVTSEAAAPTVTPTEAPISVPGIPATLAREMPIPGTFVTQISPFCGDTIEIAPDEPVLLNWTQRLASPDSETDYQANWLESVYYDITLNGQPVTDRGTLNYTVDGSSLNWWMNLGLIEPGLHYLRIQWYASRTVSTGLDIDPADGQVDTFGPGAAGQGYCALQVPEPELVQKGTSTPEMPTPTSTPLASPTPASAAPTTAPVSAAPAPLGIFEDFEQASTWERGDQPYGSFTRTSDRAYIYSGSYAGQLSYNFPTSNNDYVVFLKNRELAGRPNAISARVYGDNSGHYLNIWIKDAAGQSWQMPLGQIKHTGWWEMIAILDPAQPWPAGHISGPNNGAIDYPITFQAIVLDDIPDSYSGAGTLYIDDLTSREGMPVLPTPQVTSQPISPGRSTIYALSLGNQHLYEEPWGAPIGSPCEAFRTNSWDDENPNFRGFNVELVLTNNSAVKIQDDWGEEMRFITNTGREVTACYYGYDGAGPPPQGSTSLTFFTVVPKGEFVQTMQLNLNGEFLQICLDGRGGWNPC